MGDLGGFEVAQHGRSSVLSDSKVEEREPDELKEEAARPLSESERKALHACCGESGSPVAPMQHGRVTARWRRGGGAMVAQWWRDCGTLAAR